MRRTAHVALSLALLLGFGCREEGAVEKAGKKLDEAIDELKHPNEGPLEKFGRKTDEALEGVKEALEGEGG